MVLEADASCFVTFGILQREAPALPSSRLPRPPSEHPCSFYSWMLPPPEQQRGRITFPPLPPAAPVVVGGEEGVPPSDARHVCVIEGTNASVRGESKQSCANLVRATGLRHSDGLIPT